MLSDVSSGIGRYNTTSSSTAQHAGPITTVIIMPAPAVTGRRRSDSKAAPAVSRVRGGALITTKAAAATSLPPRPYPPPLSNAVVQPQQQPSTSTLESVSTTTAASSPGGGDVTDGPERKLLLLNASEGSESIRAYREVSRKSFCLEKKVWECEMGPLMWLNTENGSRCAVYSPLFTVNLVNVTLMVHFHMKSNVSLLQRCNVHSFLTVFRAYFSQELVPSTIYHMPHMRLTKTSGSCPWHLNECMQPS